MGRLIQVVPLAQPLHLLPRLHLHPSQRHAHRLLKAHLRGLMQVRDEYGVQRDIDIEPHRL